MAILIAGYHPDELPVFCKDEKVHSQVVLWDVSMVEDASRGRCTLPRGLKEIWFDPRQLSSFQARVKGLPYKARIPKHPYSLETVVDLLRITCPQCVTFSAIKLQRAAAIEVLEKTLQEEKRLKNIASLILEAEGLLTDEQVSYAHLVPLDRIGPEGMEVGSVRIVPLSGGFYTYFGIGSNQFLQLNARLGVANPSQEVRRLCLGFEIAGFIGEKERSVQTRYYNLTPSVSEA
jgi:hypothetical protein